MSFNIGHESMFVLNYCLKVVCILKINLGGHIIKIIDIN